MYRYRSSPDSLERGPKADDVAYLHRSMELHAIHPYQHGLLSRPPRATNFMLGSYRTRQVDVAQDNAAKDRAVRIGVGRHHYDFDSQKSIIA
jgi:hypothetical protein